MGSLNNILCAFLAISPIFYLNAQQSYDPFQYGNSPNPIQPPYVPSLEQLRNNSQTQINSTNYEAMKKTGYVSPPTQADIIANQQRQLQGKPPKLSKQQELEKEMTSLLQELTKNNQLAHEEDYYHSSKYLNDLPNYVKAKSRIKDMLDGKIPLSVKDAYYLAESAYGNVPLTYEEYNKLIASVYKHTS
ncbi:MAG: hypothetical protein JWN78_2011 [Bacteroidota bacterium]|nr:hypothetical protein [Bacteroidota bacterium]